MILVCGGIKGGSGKTTIATNLAAMRAKAGKDVLLVDADEQESATIFTAIRKRDQSQRQQYTSIILRESNLRSEIDRMRTKYDDVIVDTGGRDTGLSGRVSRLPMCCFCRLTPEVLTSGRSKMSRSF